MLIVVPVDGDNAKDSKITKVANVSKWVCVEFDDGIAKSASFYDQRDQITEEFIDFVILENKFENYMEFMEEGSMVLVVREEQRLEDILEAFRFKELDEVGL